MSRRTPDERSNVTTRPSKKRKGFSVGPSNLPDGTYKRKTQKIKRDLIQKAKVKKAYARLKAQQEEEAKADEQDTAVHDAETAAEVDLRIQGLHEEVETEMHPARAALIAQPDQNPSLHNPRFQESQRRIGHQQRDESNESDLRLHRQPRSPRADRYAKERAQAEDRRALLHAKRKSRETRDVERRAMHKAKRPGKDGKQKLGRQGSVLLSRVKRMFDEGKI